MNPIEFLNLHDERYDTQKIQQSHQYEEGTTFKRENINSNEVLISKDFETKPIVNLNLHDYIKGEEAEEENGHDQIGTSDIENKNHLNMNLGYEEHQKSKEIFTIHRLQSLNHNHSHRPQSKKNELPLVSILATSAFASGSASALASAGPSELLNHVLEIEHDSLIIPKDDEIFKQSKPSERLSQQHIIKPIIHEPLATSPSHKQKSSLKNIQDLEIISPSSIDCITEHYDIHHIDDHNYENDHINLDSPKNPTCEAFSSGKKTSSSCYQTIKEILYAKWTAINPPDPIESLALNDNESLFPSYSAFEGTCLTYMLYIIYILLIKAISNLAGKMCFVSSICDCSGNSFQNKLWTIILIIQKNILLNILTYQMFPEIKNSIKWASFLQQLINIFSIFPLAYFLDGNTNKFDNIALGIFNINLGITFFIIMIYYHKNIGLGILLKTQAFPMIYFIAGDIFITFLALPIKELLSVSDDNLSNVGLYYVMIVILSFAYIESVYHLVPLTIRDPIFSNKHNNMIKTIFISETFYYNLFGIIIGLMFNEKLAHYAYPLFLIIYLLYSFNLQTWMITLALRKFIFYLRFYKMIHRNKMIWKSPERPIYQKLIASRKFFFTYIIWFKFICFALSKEWTDPYGGDTKDCYCKMENPDDVTVFKVVILFGFDLAVDFLSMYINCKNGYKYMIYENLQRDAILEALAYFYYSAKLERYLKTFLIIKPQSAKNVSIHISIGRPIHKH